MIPAESSPSPPLIVTAQLPGPIHRWATELRRTHFPPARNWLEAHVTLFHALPAATEAELRGVLRRLAADHPPPSADLDGLVNLGQGTALRVLSPQLLDLRATIAEHFHGLLTAQDNHVPRLHITIQNKVTAQAARALQSQLAPAIPRQAFAFPALELSRYRGGPWEAAGRFPFRGR